MADEKNTPLRLATPQQQPQAQDSKSVHKTSGGPERINTRYAGAVTVISKAAGRTNEINTSGAGSVIADGSPRVIDTSCAGSVDLRVRQSNASARVTAPAGVPAKGNPTWTADGDADAFVCAGEVAVGTPLAGAAAAASATQLVSRRSIAQARAVPPLTYLAGNGDADAFVCAGEVAVGTPLAGAADGEARDARKILYAFNFALLVGFALYGLISMLSKIYG